MWNGILKIDELTIDNKIIFKNLYNTIHDDGEKYILSVLFSNTPKPFSYYFGLDRRDTIDKTQILTDVSAYEVVGGNYLRQAVSSYSEWELSEVDGIWQAKSPIITYTAVGINWLNIKNLFMTTSSSILDDSTGVIISSVALPTTTNVNAGQTIGLRMSVALHN